MTNTSIGPRELASLRPSCSCTAVKIDGFVPSGVIVNIRRMGLAPRYFFTREMNFSFSQ